MRITNNIPAVVSWLAGAFTALLVLIFPAAYCVMAYQFTAGSLEAEAEINAQLITQIISADPEMWRFEDTRLREYLSRRPRKGQAEVRRVLDDQGGLVAESADVLPGPRMARSVVLYDAGLPVGRLEVLRSLRPLLQRTALVFLAVLPVGIAAFLALRNIPLRAIRRGEAALRHEQDRAQRYLDVAGVMFLALDTRGRATMVNRKGCSLLGRFETDILGKDWFDAFVPDRDRAAERAQYERLVVGGAGQLTSSEGPVLTCSGETRIMAWHISVLPDDQGAVAGTLWSGEDITHRKHLEQQLRHAQKLEAIGQLAAGVAHDFNNILAAITGYGSILQMSMDDDDPQRHNVEQILAAAERAAYVTKSLLAFSRKQIMNPKLVDINWIVERGERLLRRLIGEDIAMRTRLLPAGIKVFADAVQIEQVLMNLATNARDAMPDGGNLVIETDQVVADAEFVQTHGLKRPGVYAHIIVSDTGTGMDEITIEKIFEPFFTTKEVGKGTGLGLANVYGIVKQHNGTIEVSSAPGKGATFHMYLPAIQTVAEDMRSAETVPPPGGAETILVAEDEESVRAMTRSILQNFGYTVLACADGDEAVRTFAEHKDRVNLVVLDVIMPKRNGKDAYEEMARLRPGLKVLYLSGHAFDVLCEEGRLDAGKPFLSKPASPAELLKKVREVLDR